MLLSSVQSTTIYMLLLSQDLESVEQNDVGYMLSTLIVSNFGFFNLILLLTRWTIIIIFVTLIAEAGSYTINVYQLKFSHCNRKWLINSKDQAASSKIYTAHKLSRSVNGPSTRVQEGRLLYFTKYT